MTPRERPTTEGRIVVVESFGPPHGRTNPDLPQLVAAMPAQVDLRYRSWRQLLVGRYDVFHLHWPEVYLTDERPWRGVARSLLLLVALLRLRLTRRALVRTLHNDRPHGALGPWGRWVLALVDRWTTLWIVLNRVSSPPTGAPAVYAPIGHSQRWFADAPAPEPVPGRLVHFGLIRAYKGVEQLLEAFAGVDDPDRTLRVVGRVLDPELGARIEGLAAADPRVTVVDDYVDDTTLAREVREAELVVLPFARVTNSGSMLVALSLGRPILVPRLPLTDQLATEVGEQWVRRFDPPLGPDDLVGTTEPPTAPPDFSAREWSDVASTHAAAFAAAVALARGEPARLPYNEAFSRDG